MNKREHHKKIQASLNSVSVWYNNTYATDPLGVKIDSDLTFDNLYELIASGKDIYSHLANDSVVRERCMFKLAELMNCNYNPELDFIAMAHSNLLGGLK